MHNDKYFMNIAIELSKTGKYPYGAIVVRDGKIIGRSDSLTNISKTIYSHAQLVAIEDALNGKDLVDGLVGCTMYSSCEPCLMAMEAILYSGINKLVYGINIEASNLYYNHVEDFSILDIVKKINPDMNIIKGLLEEEAMKVILDYNKKIIDSDENFIDVAIDISRNSFYPFGAIVVRDGRIIGRSDDNVPSKNTVFQHAELIAIDSAVSNIKDSISRGNLHECTLYTSCEPCMMCQEAILAEGISRIVYAATIEDSNQYFCKEYPVSIKDIVERSNSPIKLVEKLHRDKAIAVLKEHGRL